MTPTDVMAHLRTVWALERTQLAWVRTAFAMIAAGLALDKGTAALHEARILHNENWIQSGHFGGIALAGAASLHLAWATLTTVRRNRQLARDFQMPVASLSGVLQLSAFVATLGFTLALLLALWG